MKTKQSYSSSEFRKKIKKSIIKNGKELKNEIKLEEQYITDKTNIYV